MQFWDVSFLDGCIIDNDQDEEDDEEEKEEKENQKGRITMFFIKPKMTEHMKTNIPLNLYEMLIVQYLLCRCRRYNIAKLYFNDAQDVIFKNINVTATKSAKRRKRM